MNRPEARIHVATPHHVAPKMLYYLIFGALIVGTVLTVVVAKFDLGAPSLATFRRVGII